jgi:hypothetical protein
LLHAPRVELLHHGTRAARNGFNVAVPFEHTQRLRMVARLRCIISITFFSEGRRSPGLNSPSVIF